MFHPVALQGVDTCAPPVEYGTTLVRCLGPWVWDREFAQRLNASSAQVITGAKNIDNDADWQAYVDTIAQLGLEAYLATYQEALDTYDK
jgi:hypothetical protein